MGELDAPAACRLHIPADRERPAGWCAKCSGSNWHVVRLGTQFLLGDDVVSQREVFGSWRDGPRSGSEDLEATTRTRYAPSCWCGLQVEMRHETAESTFAEFADAGKRRVVLSRLAAKIGSK